MTLILKVKGCGIHTTMKGQEKIISRIQLRRASNERVGGPTGDNTSDFPKGIMAPGYKYLASVDDIPGSRGGIWRQFVGPRHMLGKVGRRLDV